jgi:hypothetical protein
VAITAARQRMRVAALTSDRVRRVEQCERAETMLEQLITDIDMPPERRALAVDLMLVFARAEIMRLNDR